MKNGAHSAGPQSDSGDGGGLRSLWLDIFAACGTMRLNERDAEGVRHCSPSAKSGGTSTQRNLLRIQSRRPAMNKVLQHGPSTDVVVTTVAGQVTPTHYSASTEYNEMVLSLLRQSADNGNADSQSKLGAMYACGDGVPKDYRMALEFLRRAADKGHPTPSRSAISSLAWSIRPGPWPFLDSTAQVREPQCPRIVRQPRPVRRHINNVVTSARIARRLSRTRRSN